MHEYKEPIPEPFEKRRINEVRAAESRSVYGQSVTSTVKNYSATEPAAKAPETSTAYELHRLSPAPSRHSAITTRFSYRKLKEAVFHHRPAL